MEDTLKQGSVVNIGKWFFQEGIENMFKKYYFTSRDFTSLVTNFMLHGISFMFEAAVNILARRSITFSVESLQIIRVSYLKKYGL